MDCRTNEEWFVCESCGWGFQTRVRRFAKDTLAELRDITRRSQWHDAWPLVDSILRTLLNECNEQRDDGDETILKIEDLLARDVSARTTTDVEFVEVLAAFISLYAIEDGRVVKDLVQKPPRLAQAAKYAFRQVRPTSARNGGIEEGPDADGRSGWLG